MDLHSTYNNMIAVTDSVNNMDIVHFQNFDCYQEAVHRQTCSWFDTQILGEDLHSIHTNMSVFHGVGADGINLLCHGKNRDSGYRQTRFLTLPCHNWGNFHHYKDHHTIDNQEGEDKT